MSTISPPPTLAEKYSGIPEHLLDKATKVKEQTYSLATIGATPRRAELPIIPRGHSRPRFQEALAALEQELGKDNVKVNNDSLIDGW